MGLSTTRIEYKTIRTSNNIYSCINGYDLGENTTERSEKKFLANSI